MSKYLILGSIVCASCLFSSVQAKVIILSEVMNRDMQKKTGVDSLNAKQKEALQDWLNDNFVLKSDIAAQMGKEAPETPTKLYLSQNIDSGKMILLSDDSLYLIAPEDVQYTSSWITPFPLRLEPSGDPEYPVKLVNINTNKSVKGRQIKPARQ